MPIPRVLLTTTEPCALKQDQLHRPKSSDDVTAATSSESSSRTNSEKLSGARGRVPNIFWRAVRMDDLRAQPNFEALPQESDVTLCGRASFAYVRQGTETWDALHDGRLTTGVLNAALGFNEDGVNKRALGMGKHGRGGHMAILNACARIGLEKWMDDDVDEAAATEAERRNAEALARCNAASDSSDDEDDDDDDEDNNNDTITRTNDASTPVIAADASALDVLLASMSMAKPKKPKPKKKKKKNGKKKSRGKKNRAGGDDAHMLSDAQYCRALARGGEQSIRMAWGSAQEASTLCSLMCYFGTGATVHEAGLCMLDPASVPEEWCVGPLPPVGASPDGMITLRDGERLVVEVKNSSPFREVPGSFIVFDRDPYDSPPAYHMPQVQLEMAATKTQSAFLAMQSATRGIRIFRIERDDEFIAAMLRRISRLYVSFALKGKEPPMNWEVHSSEHKKLVASAVRIARNASVFGVIPQGLLPEDGSITVDANCFLQR
jgi:hypothetical protein